jgi:phage-related protein (TIGR01555 family)
LSIKKKVAARARPGRATKLSKASSRVLAARRAQRKRAAQRAAEKAEKARAEVLAASGAARRAKAEALAGARVRPSKNNQLAFTPALHPPGTAPEQLMAHDEQLMTPLAWAAQSVYAGAFQEGLTFLGYPYLAELSQRPEYRRIVEVIATEMTRKWITIKSKSDDDDSKSEKIDKIQAAFEKFKVREVMQKSAEIDGFFGRSHLFVELREGRAGDRAELIMPIAAPDGTLLDAKIAKDSLVRLVPVEPVWCYPSNYNANDPLSINWYNPDRWIVQGTEIHRSRLVTFVGRELPDMLKPAYSFGGLSLTQMVKPYVDNWLRTRQSVSDLTSAYSVMVLSTNMQAQLAPKAGAMTFFERIELFNNTRDNRGLMVLDKDAETFANVTTPLGGLDTLQAQAQEHMASVSGIPLVKLLGIQPAGLNASSEGEIRTFYDWIEAYQQKFFGAQLRYIMNIVMLSEFGAIDEDIVFQFEPLWSLDDKEKADLRKVEAETDSVLIADGVLSPEESRKRIANDPSSPYESLDVEDMPEPPQGDDDPELGDDPENGNDPEDEGGDETGGGLKGEKVAKPTKPSASDAALASDSRGEPGASAALPFVDEVDPLTASDDAQFEEGKHPRGEGGKFAKTAGGGGAGGSIPSKEQHAENVKNAIVGQAAKNTVPYRKNLITLITISDHHGMDTAALVEKLVQSYKMRHADLTAKGNAKEAGLVEKKLAKWQKKLDASGGAKPAAAPGGMKATPQELEQAKKTTAIYSGMYAPGTKSKALMDAFNEKYANKALTNPAALEQKVADFKAMQKDIETANLKQAAVAQQSAAEKANLKQAAVAQQSAAEKAAEAAKKHTSTPEGAAMFQTMAGMWGANETVQRFDTAKKFLDSHKSSMPKDMEVHDIVAIQAYTGAHYKAVNQQLRTGSITKAQFQFAKTLSGALNKLPEYTKTTYRKATLTQAQAALYEPGYIVPERGFTSTAKSDGVWSGSHHYVIEGHGGRDISQISHHQGEQEVLFDMNSHFEVTKVVGNKIHLKEIHS